MRTLIDIPDNLLADLMSESGAKTKRMAVVTAISTYISSRRRDRLISVIGNFPFAYTLSDLEEMRRYGQHNY